MFIEEIELVDYERLKLNQFTRIIIKFTKKVQVILGTNGSGKSSLLAELSPLPAEQKYFSKNGKKRVVVKHNNKRYILTSQFNPVNHSFILEGDSEDMNPGGTITVQRDLVKKVFGIDASTHLLAIGKHEFHSMSTNVRRDWFRVLSDSNYDYAIGVFNRLREAHRDNTGALKLARNKLVSQSSKLMPVDVLNALHSETDELYKIVEFLINNRNSPTATLEETHNQIQDSLQYLEKEASIVLSSTFEIEKLLRFGFVDNVEDSNSVVFFINNKLSELRNKKNELFEDNKRNQDIVDLHEKTKMFQVATISTELERLRKRKIEITKALVYKFSTVNPKETLLALEEVSKKLIDLSYDIPINTNSTKYTRELFKEYNQVRDKLNREIDILNSDIRNYKERLEHNNEHKNSPSVTCPSCNHNWKPNYDENIIKDINEKINKSFLEIETKKLLIEDLDLKIEEFNNWVKHIECVKEYAQEFAYIKDFWSLIMKKETLFEKPRLIPLIVQGYKEELLNEILLEETNEHIKEELAKLNMTEHSNGTDHQQAIIMLSRIDKELSYIANEETRLNTMKDTVTKLSYLVKKVEVSKNNLVEKEKSLKELTNRHVEDLRRTMFNDILRSFQSDLAIKEKAINDEKMQTTVLKALEEEINTLEKNAEAYKCVLKELSPTEGIIAEGLFGYMKLFIRNMNKFIASVWSYPLIVHPCATEEGKLELNYKFPLLVNNKESIRQDIVEGSSSMREIIDLGFTVCSLKSIGLGSSTLFLDEFGSAMDPVHKQQTTKMIADIVENEKFEQIFLISHDVAQYGSIDNSEVCILNSSNVIIPNGCIYNKHVVFI